MSKILFLVGALVAPHYAMAQTCTNPETCKPPAWAANPPAGLTVGVGSTRAESFIRALGGAGSAKLTKATAAYMADYSATKKKTDKPSKKLPSNLENMEVCGIPVTSMTKQACEDEACSRVLETTYMAKMSLGKKFELKLYHQTTPTKGADKVNFNLKLSENGLSLQSVIEMARKKCLVKEVFSGGRSYTAVKEK